MEAAEDRSQVPTPEALGEADHPRPGGRERPQLRAPVENPPVAGLGGTGTYVFSLKNFSEAKRK